MKNILLAKPVASAVAAVALIVPVGLGWAFTAGADVGDVSDQISGESEDEFTSSSTDDVYIQRSVVNGQMTMRVVTKSGAEVPANEWPAELEAEVAFYETEWEPPSRDGEKEFFTEDGVTCYKLNLPDDPPPGAEQAGNSGDGATVHAYWAASDDDGNWSVQAASFDADELWNALSDDERQQFERLEIPIDDLPGGTEVLECDS